MQQAEDYDYLCGPVKKNCNIPFAPASSPVFYGWIILAVGTIGMLMSIPGQTMGVSVFTDRLIRDLAINRSNLSLAYFFGTLSSGLLITRAGKLYDRFGARTTAFAAGLMLGLTLIYLTGIGPLSRMLSGTIPEKTSTFVLLAIGFWGIRFFGQGTLTMVSRNMVMKWFDRRRGFVNGIMGILVSFGFSYAPKLLEQFIDRFRWQGTWTLLSVVLGIGFVIFVLVFYRDNPEDCQCIPDGNRLQRRPSRRPPSLPSKDHTLSQAKKSFTFWIITLAMAVNALYISGLTFHVVSVFKASGMDQEKALGIFLPASLISVAFQFVGGWISDYIKLKYLIIVYLSSLLIASGGMYLLDTMDLAYQMVVLGFGMSWGLFILLAAVTWPRFFGLKHLGAISGYSMSWMVIGSAMGPYLFSLSFAQTSSYHSIAMACFAMALILFVLSFRADNPTADPA